jgi:peptide/nickel transport system permease protein
VGGGRLVRHILHMVTVLVGVSFVAFVLIHVVPGDPARIALGPKAPQEEVDRTRDQLGLNEPLYRQYVSFVGGALHGDLGYSIQQRSEVAPLIRPRIAPTILLVAYATMIAVLIGVPLGIISAVRHDRLTDHAVRIVTMVTFAMPSFWLALVLVELVSLHLGWLPVSGYGGGIGDRARDLFLPGLTIGLYLAPMLVRTLRGSMLDALASEYIEAARARGLPGSRVVAKHALRNASIGAITVLAVNLGFLMSGTVIVERVFDIPGLGSLLVTAVEGRDFALVQALTLVFGALVVLINILADLMNAVIDPRVRSA